MLWIAAGPEMPPGLALARDATEHIFNPRRQFELLVGLGFKPAGDQIGLIRTRWPFLTKLFHSVQCRDHLDQGRPDRLRRAILHFGRIHGIVYSFFLHLIIQPNYSKTPICFL
jgi:hypothetical protein